MEQEALAPPPAPVDESPEPPGAASPRRLGRAWLVTALTAAVVAALAVTLVVVRQHDARPPAAVGQLFDQPFQEDPLPQRGTVLLPWARVQVGAGEPRDELPDLLGGVANVKAPDGGSFVRVDLVLDEDWAIPLVAVARPYAEEIDVVLRADGRDYDLLAPGGVVLDPNGPYGQGGTRWVAVEGEPTDLEVRVSVDGVTQVVDAADGSVDAGDAAEQLAAVGEMPTNDELVDQQGTRCGPVRRVDISGITISYPDRPTCRVQLVLRTPYVDGLGWAEPGREFLVVHVVRDQRLSLRSGRGEATTGWSGRSLLRASLDGAAPLAPAVAVNELNEGAFVIQDVDDPDQVVFDVPRGEAPGDLRIDLVTEARPDDPFSTATGVVHLRWTVAGGELS